MYLLKVQAGFDAAHRLPEYNGPCRRMHGHHWVVQVTWAPTAPVGGMTIDLVILKQLLHSVLSMYDHNNLNTVMTSVPTAENLAKLIFDHLKKKEFGKLLTQVAVEETKDTCVIYCEEPETRSGIPHRSD